MTTKNLENISIKDLFLDLWKLINKKRRIQVIILLALMIVSSLAEILSLISVVPFLQILLEPETIYRFKFAVNILGYFGFNDPKEFLLPITILFIFAIGFSAVIRITNLWFNNILAANIGSDFSSQAFKVIMNKPYSFHINSNSSAMINTTTKEVSDTVEIVRLILILTTSLLLVCGLIIGLFIINWQIALLSIFLVSISYFSIASYTKKILLSNSKLILRNNVSLIKATQEGLGAIRDVILHNAQKTYQDLYQASEIPIRLKQAENQSLSAFPRYCLEALGISFIATIAYFLTTKSSSNIEIIALLGSLALAAQRILPAMQQSYAAWASIKSNLAAVDKVIKILNSSTNVISNIKPSRKLVFENEIRLENIKFRYSENTPIVLNEINLTIKKGEKIGIIGETGCGKSTFIDILMGLLEPTSGYIYVDGICVNDKADKSLIKYWRNTISHVPQDIYLSDTSIAENIAFGVKKNDISYEKVRSAAKKAKISKFIESKSLGFNSLVGERGISLSGGQIQRLAIARAIYKNAEILVMDEATSALDNQTEKDIISEINSLSKNLTIIMVAHRLSSLEYCQRIIRLKNGKATLVN